MRLFIFSIFLLSGAPALAETMFNRSDLFDGQTALNAGTRDTAMHADGFCVDPYIQSSEGSPRFNPPQGISTNQALPAAGNQK